MIHVNSSHSSVSPRTAGDHVRRGFSVVDLAGVMIAVAMMLCIFMPAIARVNVRSNVQVSLNNLNTLHKALMQYGADWNDRQPTAIVDDFSAYGPDIFSAFAGYQVANSQNHPELWLGVDCSLSFNYYFSYGAGYIPIDFTTRNGGFRLPHTKHIHDYVDGKCFSETYFAPNDRILYPIAEPWFDAECEFILPANIASPNTVLRCSYMRSAAAMFDPGVMRANADGGFQNPFSYSTGFTSPTFSQAQYPHLKSHMMEHNWNQNTPADVCNPLLISALYPCEPYYFNHGLASAPATLFYDGSTRLLPNAEVIDADAQILKQTNNVDGLWHRRTPMGEVGYLGELTSDGTIVSHHILTTDGIRGRDTVAGAAGQP